MFQTVAGHESHAKAQDSYLPSFYTGASYLSNYHLPFSGREDGDDRHGYGYQRCTT